MATTVAELDAEIARFEAQIQAKHWIDAPTARRMFGPLAPTDDLVARIDAIWGLGKTPDFRQIKRDDIDCFDARLDAMPEPLGGDDE